LLCSIILLQLDAQSIQISPDLTVADSAQLHLLQTTKGDFLVGRVTKIINTTVSFQLNENTKLDYNFSEIKSLSVYNPDQQNPSSIFDSPSLPADASQEKWGFQNLAYSSTAFNFERGSGEFRNIDLLWNTFDFSVGEIGTIGGGLLIPYFLMGRAKLAFEIVPEFNIGIGTHLFYPIHDDVTGGIHPYLVATVGRPNLFINITFGEFYELENSGFHDRFLSFGGGANINENWFIKADVLFPPEDVEYIPTILAGWKKAKNRLEFGLIVLPELGVIALGDFELNVFPLVSYSVKL